MAMTLEDCRREVREWLQLKLTTGRCSTLIADELAGHMLGRTLDVFAIYDEIGALEGAGGAYPSSTKPAAPFTGQVLRGLWHKHYSTPAHMMHNIRNHWNLERLEALRVDIEADSTVPAEKKGQLMSHRLIMDGHRERHQLRQETGEWIVYAVRPAGNTYLTLASHIEPDEAIRARADQAAAEFPDPAL